MEYQSLRAALGALLLTTSLLANAQEPKAAADFLKLIPADSLTVAIRNQTELGTRMDEFAKELGLTSPVAPSAALGLFYGSVGVDPEQVDRAKPLVAVMPGTDLSGLQVAFAVPAKDTDKMLRGYQLAAADVADGKIAPTQQQDPLNRARRMFVTTRGDYLWLSSTKGTLENVLQQDTLHVRLSAAHREDLADSDVLLHFGIGALPKDQLDAGRQWWAERFSKDKTVEKNAVAVASHMESLQLKFKFDHGLRFLLRLNLDGQAEGDRALAALMGDGPSTLTGLPDGNLIVASSLHSTTDGGAAMLSEIAWVWPLGIWRSELSGVHSSVISTLLGDIVARVDNAAAGLYFNDEAKHGAMSLVTVLTPAAGPDEFVAELRSLSTFINARAARELRVGNANADVEVIEALVKQLASDSFQERQSAMTKLQLIGEPALPAIDKAKESESADLASRAEDLAISIRQAAAQQKRELLRKDILSEVKPQFLFRKNARDASRPVVEVLLQPGDATKKLNTQLTALFGSEWKRFRLAVLKEHVVVLFGSDEGLLDRTVAQINQAGPPIETEQSVITTRTRLRGERLAEWYFSASRIASVMVGNKEKPKGIPAPLSSLTLSRQTSQLRSELYLPMEELKAWKKFDDARNQR